MGTFLSLSAVVGRTQTEVIKSLINYVGSVDGGLQQANNIKADTDNCCIVQEVGGNTSILYPHDYIEWDNSSEFISAELNATVFSFHIHDGDLWMYVLYHNGQVVDQFNPIPDYWDADLSGEEISRWKGDASTIVQYVPNIKASDIEKYLVRWDLDEEESSKAYPIDKFTKEEWQLVDFMSKLQLPYPIDDNRNPKGSTYKLWTKQLKLVTQKSDSSFEREDTSTSDKPWWKFW